MIEFTLAVLLTLAGIAIVISLASMATQMVLTTRKEWRNRNLR